jgi:hypothetical protein
LHALSVLPRKHVGYQYETIVRTHRAYCNALMTMPIFGSR